MVTKNAFDKEELMGQIVRTKRELAFTQKAAYSNKLNRDVSGKAGRNDGDLDRTIKQVETIEIQKKAL